MNFMQCCNKENIESKCFSSKTLFFTYKLNERGDYVKNYYSLPELVEILHETAKERQTYAES